MKKYIRKGYSIAARVLFPITSLGIVLCAIENDTLRNVFEQKDEIVINQIKFFNLVSFITGMAAGLLLAMVYIIYLELTKLERK